MFESLSRALTKVIETDTAKLEQRKSRRAGGVGSKSTNKTSYGTYDSFIGEDEDEIMEDRAKWQTDDIVILHLIGYVVGLTNVWRFPFLCYRHGGFAFIIPYTLFLFLCAFPFVYLELLVGQFAQVGAIAAFKLVPLFKGVGFCMVTLAYLSCFNVQSVLGWCLFYLFQSTVHNPLPWISCDNGFGRLSTGQSSNQEVRKMAEHQIEDKINWHTVNCTEFYADSTSKHNKLEEHERLPGKEYFLGRVQRMWKSGYDDKEASNYTLDNGQEWFGLDEENTGVLNYHADTIVALIFSFLIVHYFVQRGTKISGKLITSFVIIPYIILALLFYRASGLSGAWSGFDFLGKTSNFSKICEFETWWRAGEQVFRSTGAGLGIHLAIASHNHVPRNVLTDSLFIVSLNAMTSIFSSTVIFMFLGHVKSTVLGEKQEINLLIVQGPELVFEVMADVLGVLAKANFYSVCFYLMLFLIGLTTITASLACTKTSTLEILPIQLKYNAKIRYFIVGGLGLFRVLACSLNLTRGGLHLFAFFETFLGRFSLIINSILFLIAISWFWGLEKILLACNAMGIVEPGIYFQICWKFISIIVLLMIFCGLACDPESHSVQFGRNPDDFINLSTFMKVFAYIISLAPLILCIICGIYSTWKKLRGAHNFKEKLLLSLSPTKDHNDIKEDGTGERATLRHYFYLYANIIGTGYNFFWRNPGPKINQVAPTPEPATPLPSEHGNLNNEPIGVLLTNDNEKALEIVVEKPKAEDVQKKRASLESRKTRRMSTESHMQKNGACAIL